MKLAVSNIAWNYEENHNIFNLLKSISVDGIEIAPTKLWPSWEGASVKNAKVIGKYFKDEGFIIPSLQAILFGKPELQLFGDINSLRKLEEHISLVSDLANELGAKKLVFGAPKNRNPGQLNPDLAWNNAVNTFKRLGEICLSRNVQLCVEANPRAYDCNFITNFDEAAELVNDVNSLGIGLHLDTGCALMAGDSISLLESYLDKVNHVHISEPNLGLFKTPLVDHNSLGEMLKKSKYSGWAVIEMRSNNCQDDLINIREACSVANQYYF